MGSAGEVIFNSPFFAKPPSNFIIGVLASESISIHNIFSSCPVLPTAILENELPRENKTCLRRVLALPIAMKLNCVLTSSTNATVSGTIQNPNGILRPDPAFKAVNE